MKKTIIILLTIFVTSCQTNEIKFDGNSAFNWLEQQCEFGSRNPGSVGYIDCKEFLINNLEYLSDSVFTQNFINTELRENKTYDLSNIIAEFKVNSEKHILLGAHWDTRPWADRDLDISKHSTPIIGANDGASGVAILMELAKIMILSLPCFAIKPISDIETTFLDLTQ